MKKNGFAALSTLPLIQIATGFLGLASLFCPSLQAEDTTRHILFVGDSFTHGRYLPVRQYNNTPGTGGVGITRPSTHVVDENFDTTVPGRMENGHGETGPWGGIPGIFAELAHEARLPYNVHIEAISATSLTKNYAVASDVIDRPEWDAVVLQEASFEPIPAQLSGTSISNPATFCQAVKTIEQGIHDGNPEANVYLYSTWAPADTAYKLSASDTAHFDEKFLQSLAVLTAAYRNAYLSAAVHDGRITAIAPVGDAWAQAWAEGVANPDPYAGHHPGVSLSFNYQPDSEPSTRDVPTDAGYHHPSIYGAYLSGLVLFETITGHDVREFGPAEHAAVRLGIDGHVAVQLQEVASKTVQEHNPNRGTGLRMGLTPGADACADTGKMGNP
ncbi:hypothetical protein [Silvibacterium dinghuense]|uniref:Uncharacterized protein n=1 Tax=Silvibacterium dinghuense TaxID=1560006 RepID=A0A4Q1SKM6_9BACT|nr:hypothetical protein [Silvibacterium dinghuense]RXS98027.1 hypothetical protein ESZ00_09345 [Silvibacterium dinghuense]GGH03924.1 hypothetical protein GCM10011586_19930 [Silvibacterium dinghuense]